MQNNFKNLSDQLFKSLNKEEILTLSLSGESSHFCRFNESKVRQISHVIDGNINLELICRNKKTVHELTLTSDFDSTLMKL